MAKSIIEGSVKVPGIDQQIDYIKHLRKDIIPFVKHLQTGLDMITAIEQSLLAAKIFDRSGKKQPGDSPMGAVHSINNVYHQILNSFRIKLTAIRIEVLKAILASNGEFTVRQIHKVLSKRKSVSKAAVISTLILFKIRGLIQERKDEVSDKRRGIGRPEIKYIYRK
jgi:predicted transcriptional regulator